MISQLKECFSGGVLVIDISIAGVDNRLRYYEGIEPRVIGNAKINIRGNGNVVDFGKGVILNNFSLDIQADACQVLVGDGVRFSGKIIMKITSNNFLRVGSKTTIGGCSFVVGEGGSISIGDDCMLSWGIDIRNTDSHAIFDINSKRVNPAKDIVISNHVWVGARATILGGARLGENTVVGIGSVVKGEHEPGVVLVGVPARVVKRGVNWSRELLG